MRTLKIANRDGQIEYQLDVEKNSQVEEIVVRLFPLWDYQKSTWVIPDDSLRHAAIANLTSILQYNGIDTGVSLG